MQIKNERDQLEEELFGYRVDAKKEGPEVVRGQIMVATTSMNVQNLPNEMLILILEYFFAINHRLIRRLLLVCKHWNHIIMQSPRLWARIQLSPVSFTVYEDSHILLQQYIEVCLQRSQPLLLDIELDYESFRTCEDYIRDMIYFSTLSVADEDEEDAIFDWSLSVDCDFRSTAYDKYLEDTIADLATLIGPTSIHTERWRTLYFFVPWRDPLTAADIWNMFIGTKSNLQSLSIV